MWLVAVLWCYVAPQHRNQPHLYCCILLVFFLHALTSIIPPKISRLFSLNSKFQFSHPDGTLGTAIISHNSKNVSLLLTSILSVRPILTTHTHTHTHTYIHTYIHTYSNLSRPKKRTVLFWTITQQVVVIPYRRFGISYQSIFHSWPLKTRPIDRPDSSVRS